MIKLFALLAILTFSLSACYYDSEEELYPDFGQACDTALVQYTPQISGIINNHCIVCHGASVAASLGGGVNLSSFTLVSDQADAVLGAISHSGGYSPMPKGSSRLDNCSIAKVDKWIRDGKPQ